MVAMKTVLPATSPLFVASVRLVPAGAVLIAWAALNKRPWPNTANAWAAIALFGLVDGTMFQGFLSEGLQRTSAGLGSVIIDSQPLTVAVLASVIYGETIGAGGVFGLFLGVVGLLMLELPREALEGLFHGDAATAIAAITSGVDAEGGLWESGEWWMLLAAQSMAVGTVMVRWVCKYVDPVMATGWHMALGGVPLLAYSVINEPEVYLSFGRTHRERGRRARVHVHARERARVRGVFLLRVEREPHEAVVADVLDADVCRAVRVHFVGGDVRRGPARGRARDRGGDLSREHARERGRRIREKLGRIF